MKPAKSTLIKLREIYANRWLRKWPLDDKYLTELWIEARIDNGAITHQVPPKAVWEDCLISMRENHEF